MNTTNDMNTTSDFTNDKENNKITDLIILLQDLQNQHSYITKTIHNTDILQKWNDYIEEQIDFIYNIILKQHTEYQQLISFYNSIKHDKSKVEAFNKIKIDFLDYIVKRIYSKQ